MAWSLSKQCNFMASLTVYNLAGKTIKQLDVPDDIFSVTADPALVQFVANAQRANRAKPYASTQTRDEVRGGGRKPWRQKGTGRARQGSIRSPQWKGGGVVFGPNSERNQTKKVNQKTRRKAIRMMLSDKVANQALLVIDSFENLTGKTSEISKLLTALSLTKPSALIAIDKKSDQLTRAAHNLPRVNTILADSVNVGDLLTYRYLIIDEAGVNKISEHFKA